MNYFEIKLQDEYEFLKGTNHDIVVKCYLPENYHINGRENRKRPCMVVCPGGGYMGAYPLEGEPIAMHFLPKGFNVFTIYYSPAPNRFPTQLREVAALFDLIHKNAEKWNCDTEKIGIMGFSAGGHLAAHYSNCYNCEEIKEVLGEGKRPFCSVLCYPVVSADESLGHVASFKNLLGHTPDRDETDRFSTHKMITPDTPMAYIWHTSHDNVVDVRHSLLYAEGLSKYKIPYEMHIYPYGWHGLCTCDRETLETTDPKVLHDSEWLESLKKWIDIVFYNG